MTKTKTPEKKPKRTPSRKTSEKAQFQRFVETARRIGVDQDPEALDRAFKKITPQKNHYK
jgi:hypothetical protein